MKSICGGFHLFVVTKQVRLPHYNWQDDLRVWRWMWEASSLALSILQMNVRNKIEIIWDQCKYGWLMEGMDLMGWRICFSMAQLSTKWKTWVSCIGNTPADKPWMKWSIQSFPNICMFQGDRKLKGNKQHLASIVLWNKVRFVFVF